MSTESLHLDVALRGLLPLALFLVNIIDFTTRGKAKRGQLWYVELKGSQKVVLPILVLAIALSHGLSYVFPWSNHVFLAMIPAYIAYMNIHAIVWRRR